MNEIVFDGQQTDERILSILKPDATPVALRSLILVLALLFFYFVIRSVALLAPHISGPILVFSTVFLFLVIIITVAWTYFSFHTSITYLTDRRIIRFEPVSPIFTSKRALFWTEALKAKTYQSNMILRILKIGNVEVESQAQPNESVRVTDLYLYEDIANYIDKIIFTVKSKPQDIPNLRIFIPKPKGQRG